ncbi:hypothetical protein PENTCL1PPCAC_9778, partial [Pristionchus entomophagus]
EMLLATPLRQPQQQLQHSPANGNGSWSDDQKPGHAERSLIDQPDMMSCHVFARSYKDPLLAFTNLPSASDLISHFGTEAPVRYYLCMPSSAAADAARLAPPTSLQPLIHQLGTIVISPSSRSDSFAPRLLPEYVEPPKKQSAKSAVKKRKQQPLAMNADHEGSDEFVLPPVAKQAREHAAATPAHLQRQSYASQAATERKLQQYVLPAQHRKQQQQHSPPESSHSPFPSPPEEMMMGSTPRARYSPQSYGSAHGSYQMAPSPIMKEEAPRAASLNEYRASYERMVAEQEAKYRQTHRLQLLQQQLSAAAAGALPAPPRRKSPPLQQQLQAQRVAHASEAARRAALDRQRLQHQQNQQLQFRQLQHPLQMQQRPQHFATVVQQQQSSPHQSQQQKPQHYVSMQQPSPPAGPSPLSSPSTGSSSFVLTAGGLQRLQQSQQQQGGYY